MAEEIQGITSVGYILHKGYGVISNNAYAYQ